MIKSILEEFKNLKLPPKTLNEFKKVKWIPKDVYANSQFKELQKDLEPYIITLPNVGESTLDEQEQMMYILTNRKIPIVRKGIVHLYTRQWYEPASHNTLDRILSLSHKISNLELEHVKLTDDYYVNFNYLEEE